MSRTYEIKSDVFLYNNHPLAVGTFVALCSSLNIVGTLNINIKQLKHCLPLKQTIETVTVCTQWSETVT
jgi:hypothetical protein